jgi:hypothetical protein
MLNINNKGNLGIAIVRQLFYRGTKVDSENEVTINPISQ